MIVFSSSYNTTVCEACDGGYEALHQGALNCTPCAKGRASRMFKNEIKDIVHQDKVINVIKTGLKFMLVMFHLLSKCKHFSD